ncbi:MAG: crosslink repair DNA glycosylase YcaQ family protein [Ilumatobacter sp.]
MSCQRSSQFLDHGSASRHRRAALVRVPVEVGVFDKNGNAGPTVWLDGQVVGVWTQRADGEVVVELAHGLGADVRRLADAEAARIADWLGDVRVNWRYPTRSTKRLEG